MSSEDEVVLKFAQKLANNELKIRKRTLKKLSKWLSAKSKSKNGLSDEELLKIWKGLHYCMWMCDKPLVQEELANSLTGLVQGFSSLESSLQFVGAFFQTEALEWPLIDRIRINKFMMLIRRMLNQTFVLLQRNDWQAEHIRLMVTRLTEVGVIGSDADRVPDGLKWHIIDVYLPELLKVAANEIAGETAVLFIQSYCTLLANTKSQTLFKYVLDNIFEQIINDAITRHREKNRVENGENSDDSEDNDVEMVDEDDAQVEAKLEFDLLALADMLFNAAKKKTAVTRNRKVIYNLVTRLRNLAAGKFPPEKLPQPIESDHSISDGEIDLATERFVAMEDEITLGERERRVENKRKKRESKLQNTDSDADEDDKDESVTVRGQDTPGDKAKTKNKFKEGEEKFKVKAKNKKQQESRKALKKLKEQQVASQSDSDEEFSSTEADNEVHIRDSAAGDVVMDTNSGSDEEISLADIKALLGSNNTKKMTDMLFEGGFVDSDDEETEEGTTKQNKKTKKKKKKKKGKSLVNGDLNSELLDSPENSESCDNAKSGHNSKTGGNNKGGDNLNTIDIATLGLNNKTNNNKKVLKINNAEELVAVTKSMVTVPGESPGAKTESAKKKKKKRNSLLRNESEIEDGPIIVDNDSVQNEAETSLLKSSKKSKKNRNSLLNSDAGNNSIVINDEDSTTGDVKKSTAIVKSPKKRKSTESKIVNNEIVFNDITIDNSGISLEIVSDAASDNMTPTTSRGKKSPKTSAVKKKPQNAVINSPAVISVNTNMSASTASGKKKRKKCNSESSENIQAGGLTEGVDAEDVEIFIPNKKYKGEFSDWAKQQASEASNKENSRLASNKKRGTTPASEKPFMTFDKHAPTPPAFIRKSVTKVTPKTEPKKSSKKEVDDGGPMSAGKRRVSFGLHKNCSQSTIEYNKSIQKTPEVPFNPDDRPERGGILKVTPRGKSSPGIKTPKSKLKFSAGKNKSSEKKKKARRASAQDFF